MPFIAMLVFGTVDLGRAYRLQNQLENAAREGGRFVQTAPEQVVPGVSCGDPNNVTWVINHEEGVHNYTVTVDRVATNGSKLNLASCKTLQDVTSLVSPGDRVRVTVSSPFTVLTPLVSAFAPSPVTVSGSDYVMVQGL